MNTSAVFEDRPACPACGAGDPQVIYDVPFDEGPLFDFLQTYYQGKFTLDMLKGARFRVGQCRSCGLLWHLHILTLPYMIKLYEEWIVPKPEFDRQKNNNAVSAAHRAVEVQAISKLLGGKPPYETEVLDYGTGLGYWPLTAKGFGYNAHGFELSAYRVGLLRENGISVIDSEEALLKKSFDFINANQCFEHLGNPGETVKLLAGRLNPGGVLRLAVPDCKGVADALKNHTWKPKKDQIFPPEHINGFTFASLKKLGERAGLSVIPYPMLFAGRTGFKDVFRGAAVSLYRRNNGTTLYFRKV